MKRWQVVRGQILYRKQLFNVGDLMPETFTDTDRNTNIFGRRLAQVEVPDGPISITPKATKPVATPKTK